MAIPFEVLADLPASFNAVRLRGCADRPGAPSPVRRNSKLDALARRMAGGEELHAAALKAGYRELKAASFKMQGVPDDLQVERVLARQFCPQVLDSGYTEIGTYRRGPDIWAVMASPFRPPTPREAAAISKRVLELTNSARATARQCGREPFGAAAPLTLSSTLQRAAMAHSRDMADHSAFDHKGTDGSLPSDRVARTGYKWRMIGENLASGMTTADEVGAGWINSPHHCENIMGPRFAEMGVAYFFNPGSADGIYWTQVFGTPAR